MKKNEERCCGTCESSGQCDAIYGGNCDWPDKNLPQVMLEFGVNSYHVEYNDGGQCPVWTKRKK